MSITGKTIKAENWPPQNFWFLIKQFSERNAKNLNFFRKLGDNNWCCFLSAAPSLQSFHSASLIMYKIVFNLWNSIKREYLLEQTWLHFVTLEWETLYCTTCKQGQKWWYHNVTTKKQKFKKALALLCTWITTVPSGPGMPVNIKFHCPPIALLRILSLRFFKILNPKDIGLLKSRVIWESSSSRV